MIQSMTGYGRGEAEGTTGTYMVEISSTNHRFLEVKARLPRGWASFEPRIQKEISLRFKRGHLDLHLFQRNREEKQGGLAVDWGLAEQYFQSLRLLKSRLRLPGRIDIPLVGGMREIFSPEEYHATEESWEDMQRALHQALDDLDQMRRREGRALETQIQAGFLEAGRLLESIVSRWPEAKKEHQGKIRGRIVEMIQGEEPERSRLEQELAFWAEKWDITEETSRLGSHLKQVQTFLVQDAPSGRPLDFLLQEMNREANTISAKASDASISHLTINLKAELEKLREQVQNVE
jgi:uncharacterized protein (TIGR00255 family)